MIGNIFAESPWEIARLGKFTSSKIDALFTEPRSKADKEAGKLSETAKAYIYEKASEIITGTTRQFTSAATEWGENYEQEAAEFIQTLYPHMEYFGKKEPKYFAYSDFSGGSPDGVDYEFNVVHEIKCPENPANHVEYCLMKSGQDLKEAQRDYYHQIQFNMMAVAKDMGLAFNKISAVFHSYCPIVNEPYLKLKSLEIEPDMDFYEKISKVLPRAERTLADVVWALNAQNNQVIIAAHDPKVNATIIEDPNALKI